jgi:hypothetical protein
VDSIEGNPFPGTGWLKQIRDGLDKSSVTFEDQIYHEALRASMRE